jgi:MFS family permease
MHQMTPNKTETSNTMFFGILMGLNLGLIFMNVPAALDRLMVIYNISYLRTSILISALLWSHAFMQVPAGMLADRLGVRSALFLSVLFICVGNMIPIFSPTLMPAILGRVITGFGTGLSFVTTMKLAALYAPPNRVGMYQGFFGGAFSLGGILAYLIIPGLMTLGWQLTFLTPVITTLLLIPLLFKLPLGMGSPSAQTPLSLGRVIRVREGWILGAYHALAWASIINLGNWIPSLLADASRTATAGQMAWGGALIMLISGVGRMSGGFALLRFSSLAVAHGSLLFLSATFILLFFATGTGPMLVLALLAASFASINFGAIFQLASRSISQESLATMMGFINFLANVSAIGVAILFGWLRDATGSFSWAFPVLSAAAVFAVVLGQGRLRRFQKAIILESVP